MMESAILLLATGFGLGWLPWAPGTFGSLPGVPLAWWLLGRPRMLQLGMMVFLVAGGILLCHLASPLLGGGDASQIVVDELLAFPVAVLGLSVARSPWVMALALVLYRIFDIAKLPPVSTMEALGGGPGIMLDDVAAAFCTWVVLVAGYALWRRTRKTSG